MRDEDRSRADVSMRGEKPQPRHRPRGASCPPGWGRGIGWGVTWVVLVGCLVLGQPILGMAESPWISIGPPGGVVTALAVHPTTPTTLYAGTQLGSAFVLHQAATPTVVLRMSENLAAPGTTHTLQAALAPGEPPLAADLYVALQCPDGSLRFLHADGSLHPTLAPWRSSWAGTALSQRVLEYLFTGSEPAGHYAVLAGVAQSGTTTFVGPIVRAPFEFIP